MKRKLLPALFSLCFLFLFTQIALAKKEEIKLNLKKGEHYIYLITQDDTVSDNYKETSLIQKVASKIDHEVIGQLPNGNYRIEATIKSFSIELKYDGKTLRYHSDTIDVMNSLYKPLNFLTGIKLKYEVSPEGIVSNLSGFESIKEKMKSDKRLPGLLRFFGNERFILDMYLYIPDGNIKIGDGWTKSSVLPDLLDHKYDIQYTLTKESAQELIISQKTSFNYATEMPKESGLEGNVDNKCTQNGYLLINPTTKMPISSGIDQHIDISIEKNTQQNEKKISRSIITHTTMILVKK